MQMKDVAKKLNNWKEINIQKNYSLKQLFKIQKNLQQTYYRQFNGQNGKEFFPMFFVKDVDYKQKMKWTKQNILRIFDQLRQRYNWSKNCDSNNVKQNLLFQLIDAMHFILNIGLIWQIENEITSLYYYTITPLSSEIFEEFEFQYIQNDILDMNFKTSQLLNCFEWKPWKIKNNELNLGPVVQRSVKLLNDIYIRFHNLGYESKDIYKMYIAKNNQNFKRQVQMQGYKS